MFGGNNNKENGGPNAAARGGSPSGGLNTINEGTTLTGDLVAQSDIRVDGTINGDLQCKAKVIIGPKGTIKGTIVCENAVIEGIFDGTLKVRDSLSIKETAKITGDVATIKINMNPGCSFEGTLTTKENAVKSPNRPSSANNSKAAAPKADAKVG